MSMIFPYVPLPPFKATPEYTDNVTRIEYDCLGVLRALCGKAVAGVAVAYPRSFNVGGADIPVCHGGRMPGRPTRA